MDESKIMVVSMTDGRVGLTYEPARFHRVWPSRGAKIAVDKEMLREAIYEEGVATLFREGMLYIEDMAFKKELGLEPDDAEEPQNIIPLDEKLMRRMMTVMPTAEFKDRIKALSREQCMDLADYAVENELTNFEKCEVLRGLTGINILNAIQNKRLSEEPANDTVSNNL